MDVTDLNAEFDTDSESLSKLPSNTCQERNSRKKNPELLIFGYLMKNIPNYQRQGNIAGQWLKQI